MSCASFPGSGFNGLELAGAWLSKACWRFIWFGDDMRARRAETQWLLRSQRRTPDSGFCPGIFRNSRRALVVFLLPLASIKTAQVRRAMAFPLLRSVLLLSAVSSSNADDACTMKTVVAGNDTELSSTWLSPMHAIANRMPPPVKCLHHVHHH